MSDTFYAILLDRAVRREAVLIEMLERWQSELQPIILMRDGHVIGLGAEEHGVTATDHQGRVIIVIEAPECDCSQFHEMCSPILGGFNCAGVYRMPPRPKNCRIFSKGKSP